MKKIFVILLVCCSLFLTGCINNEQLLEPSQNGDIIVYSQSPNFGSIEDEYNYYYIKLTADKKLIWGKAVSGVEGEKQLTHSQYQSIVNIAYRKEFKNIKSDISDKSVSDGYSATITIFYDDGTTFEIGGVNPNEKTYNKLVEKLRYYAK